MGMLLSATPSGVDAVISSFGKVLSLGGDIFDFMLVNPLLCLMLAASLVPIGFSIIRGLMSTASSH